MTTTSDETGPEATDEGSQPGNPETPGHTEWSETVVGAKIDGLAALSSGLRVGWLDTEFEDDGLTVLVDITCGAGVDSEWVNLTLTIDPAGEDDVHYERFSMGDLAQLWIKAALERAKAERAER